MTREEAKTLFRDDVDSYGKPKKIMSKVDQIYNEFEAREMLLSTQNVYCDDCKHYLSDNGNFPIEPCGECSRFYADKFERKEDV